MKRQGKSVKLADIAEKLNVSVVTVSKALSGQKGVSDEMRKKISDLAFEMGYISLTERKLQEENKSFNIGVIISGRYCDQFESFYWRMYQEVAKESVACNSFTLLEIINIDDENNVVTPKLVKDGKIDGLIIVGRMKDKYLEMIDSTVSLPMIYLDFYCNNTEKDAVITDNFHGMYRLVNYLISMGHKKIAYVGSLLYSSSITDRYFGYCKAMFENGLEIKKDWVMDDRDMETGAIDGFKFAFPKDMPTAFACNSDLTADYLIQELEKKGLKVPGDISIVGFDNYVFNQVSQVGITTSDVDISSMANEAVKILIKKMKGLKYREGMSLITSKMIIKESVKKIN